VGLACTGTACVLALGLLAPLAAAQVQPAERSSRWDVITFKGIEEGGRSCIKRLDVVPEYSPRWDVVIFKYPAHPEDPYIRRLDQLPARR
jgi:hypothetical protein